MNSFIDYLKESNDYYSGTGANEDTIRSSQADLALVFAKEYIDYLKECGIASADGHEFTGITKSKRLNVVDVTLEIRTRYQVPMELYVIEALHIDGIFIMQNNKGYIYVLYPNGNLEKLADSAFDYVKNQRFHDLEMDDDKAK